MKTTISTSREKGNLLGIQGFDVHDGPGIRTKVLFKGCPLKCLWCCNPEGRKNQLEIGVFSERCIGVDKCGWCLPVCTQYREPVLIVENCKVVGIDRQNCLTCFNCAEACPSGALKIFGKEMTVEEVMEEVLGDVDFYQNSGGGVTLSGGEPLVQWKFVLELLKECKKNDVHTCVETGMHCRKNVLDKILPYTDLIITDIKHMDSTQHKKLTGVNNRLILKNIIRTVERAVSLVIRIPIIPGCNNSEENIRATAEFIVNALDNLPRQVQLLPYRRWKRDRYRALDIENPIDNIELPEKLDYMGNVAHLVEVMKYYGVPAVAGTTHKIR